MREMESSESSRACERGTCRRTANESKEENEIGRECARRRCACVRVRLEGVIDSGERRAREKSGAGGKTRKRRRQVCGEERVEPERPITSFNLYRQSVS